MMFCTNCGAQLRDGSKFCPHCGTKLKQTQERAASEAVEPVTPVGQPEQEAQVYYKDSARGAAEATVLDFAGSAEETSGSASAFPIQEPVGSGKKKKNGVLIGIIAAVAAVAAVAVLLLTGVLSSPKAKLEKAVKQSVRAYEDVYHDLGGMDIAALSAGEKVSQNLEFSISKLDDDSTYDGIGARISSDVNLPGQKMDFTVTPFYESADIATIQFGMDGTKAYVGSPELTKGQFYGVDTATLGQDIAKFIDDDYLEDLSFNVFDLIKDLNEIQDTDAAKSNIKAANKALIDSLEIKKQGQETISVNDNRVKAVKYHVVLTEKAMNTYLKALEKSIDTKQAVKKMNAILKDIGLPEDLQDDLRMEYEDVDLSDAFDSLRDAVDELGDIEVDAYVAKGYLAAVVYEGKIDGARVTVEVQLGGGKNYVDDITMIFKVKGGGEAVLTSSGNHSGKGGVFTDETSLTVKEDGRSKETLFAAESEYHKKDGSIESEIELDGTSISLEGTWKMDKSSLDVQLSEVKVKSWGSILFEGAVSYSIGSYKSSGTKVSDVKMILSMSEDELMETVEDIGENFADIAEDLDLDFNPLDELFGYGYRTEPAIDGPAEYHSDDYWNGYDAGYADGYDDGWDEVDIDLSDATLYSGDAADGYYDGYTTGYVDGYYGYDYGANYGS